MTKRVAKKKGPKFRVGQVVVGTHSRDYLSRIKAFIESETIFGTQSASDLRPLTAREQGGK